MKLKKYFPAELSRSALKSYKPYILSHVLDPRFKTRHFRTDRLFYFYSTIEEDVKSLLIKEYNK